VAGVQGGGYNRDEVGKKYELLKLVLSLDSKGGVQLGSSELR
jgi:hypothetical protein